MRKAASLARSRVIEARTQAGLTRAPLALCLLFAACTIVEADLEPAPIGSVGSVQPSNGGTSAAPLDPSPCQVDADCDSSVRTCVEGVCRLSECLAAADVPRCELELCPAGSCMAADCRDGRKNGTETDIDCGGGCLTCSASPTCSVDADCQSGACEAGRCSEASCSDGRRNGGEAATDCGGPCAVRCADGSTCSNTADCASRGCESGQCAVASCSDGVANQDESDADCGGASCARCAAGKQCSADVDCESGLVCPEASRRCTGVDCFDGSKNGAELLTDCGGGQCPGCDAGSPCNSGVDCASQVCTNELCSAPSCEDETRNQDETDVDCGGSCGDTCATGGACTGEGDCASSVCGTNACAPGIERCCQAPTCTDGIANGNEPVIDCGAAPCGLCVPGHACTAGNQCESGRCVGNVCTVLETCTDGARNNGESDTDCGGADQSCPRCGNGRACAANRDCQSATCAQGSCVACNDGRQNGNETDTDCGGATSCQRCRDGDTCSAGSDCASGSCAQGLCVSCFDGRQNGSETDVDCGGSCADCAPGLRCGTGADCNSAVCVAEAGVNRCCGGSGEHCTRCAEQLSAAQNCGGARDSTGVTNCTAFLACLANNPVICSTPNTPGCTGEAGGVCRHNSFGGAAGTGVSQANAVLQNAGCQLTP